MEHICARVALGLILTCGMVGLALSAGELAAGPPDQTQASGAVQPRDPPAAMDVELLRQEVRLLKEFQSDVLATVYWSLGGVLAFALILVTYGWFTNYRVYERDKDALTAEVTSAARSEVAAAAQKQGSDMLNERARVDAALDSLRTELRERTDQLLGDEKITQAAAITRVEEGLAVRVAKVERKVDRSARRVELRVIRVERDLATEAKKYHLVTTFAIQQLERALELDSEFHTEDAIDALSDAISKGGELTRDEVEVLPELLKRVPQKLSEKRDQLLQAVQKAEILD
jgi:hypothetical protein